jgi:hypothetical protein
MTATDFFKAPLRWFKEWLARFSAHPRQDLVREAPLHHSHTNDTASANGDRYRVDGDMTGTINIVGDHNTVRFNKGQGIQTGASMKALLSHAEFASRAHHAALASYDGDLRGRERELAEVGGHLVGNWQVLVLHGPGGIGKTRLLLALPEVVQDEMLLWYMRNEASAESLERAIATLDRHQQHLIVVDDAHRCALLRQLQEVLVHPDLAGNVKLLLATRSVFQQVVLDALPSVPGDRLWFSEVERLSAGALDDILQHSPYQITNNETRHALIRVADGSPLFAGVGAGLVQRGVSLANLSQDQVLTYYLDQVLRDLARVESAFYARAIDYLEVISALGTLELHYQELRERVRHELDISETTEDRLIADLLTAKLLERSGTVLRISSEVLSDHILFSHFFDARSRRWDYSKRIMEPFFLLKPKEILANLAKAEVRGESPEAGLLLGQKLDELLHIIETAGNIVRYLILNWIERVAYARPNDILAISIPIVDGPEQPAETVEHEVLPITITHALLLEQVADILSRAVYQGDVNTIVAYLAKLALYRPEEAAYERVRRKTRDILVRMATFHPGASPVLPAVLLTAVRRWLEQDFSLFFNLCIALIPPLLKLEIERSSMSPLRPLTFTIERGGMAPNEAVGDIRRQALDLLYEAYPRASTIPARISIVDALEGSLPPTLPYAQVSAETLAWLHADCARTIHFFSTVVLPEAALPVLDAVVHWLWQARHFSGYPLAEFDGLRQQLREHGPYQLYRALAGRMWLNEETDELDMDAGDQFRQQAVERYLEGLSPATIGKGIRELEMVSLQARLAGNSNTVWLDKLLDLIGERYPALARQVIEEAVAGDLSLKDHLSYLLAGLRRGDPGAARMYMTTWIEAEDVLLHEAIAGSYFSAEWPSLPPKEWEMVQQLARNGPLRVHLILLRLIPLFAPDYPDQAVQCLRLVAAGGEAAALGRMAELLARTRPPEQRWAIEVSDPQDYLYLCQQLERLPALDESAQRCLYRLGQIEPMWVVDLLERRIRCRSAQQHQDTDYEAIPLEMYQHAGSIRSSSAYRAVLRRIRDWMIRDEEAFYFLAPRTLKAMAGTLDEVLASVLHEWIEAEDTHKQGNVATILQVFNAGERFYALGKALLLRTSAADVQECLRDAVESTPGAVIGPISSFTSRRLKEVADYWLQDTDFRVQRFAQQVYQSLQEKLRQERIQEEVARRDW